MNTYIQSVAEGDEFAVDHRAGGRYRRNPGPGLFPSGRLSRWHPSFRLLANDRLVRVVPERLTRIIGRYLQKSRNVICYATCPCLSSHLNYFGRYFRNGLVADVEDVSLDGYRFPGNEPSPPHPRRDDNGP